MFSSYFNLSIQFNYCSCEAVIKSVYDSFSEWYDRGPLSGNTFRVGYQLSIRHALGTVLEVHQSSENTYRYFHIIKNKNMYSLSYAAQYYCLLVVFVRLITFVDLLIEHFKTLLFSKCSQQAEKVN